MAKHTQTFLVTLHLDKPYPQSATRRLLRSKLTGWRLWFGKGKREYVTVERVTIQHTP